MGDILFTNGIIYSLEREGEKFGSMLVRGGKIVKLFPDAYPDVKADETVDLEGKAVLPGFIDSHVHFMMTVVAETMGSRVSFIDGNEIAPRDMAEVRIRLESIAAKKTNKQPLLFYNYIIPAVEEKRLPFRQELDEWFPGRTVTVISMDGHSSSHSSEALTQMQLVDVKGDGILTGEAHDLNMGKINAFIQSKLSIGLLLKGLVDITEEALSHGITGMQCLEGFDDDPADRTPWFMTRIASALPLKLRMSLQYLDPARCKQYENYLARKRIGGCGAWEMDGSVSSHTAAFYDDYRDRPGTKGECYYSQEETDMMVLRAQSAGYQVSVHAIGTAAIERILTSFENAIMNGNPMRHAIDHFEFPSRDQVERAVAIKLLLIPQPGFALFDAKYQKSYSQFLSDTVIGMQIPLKTIADAGGMILGSSDSPVQHLSPFMQLQGMVAFPVGNESLSMYQALRAYTYNGAYLVHEEHERGTLASGKAADFIVLKSDPFLVPEEQIHTLTVSQTWINGRRMYPGKKLNPWAILLKGMFGFRQKV